ncbi:MAG TPA: HAD family hydrolase [Solirubrobacterales bacterium]|nr:HAD family hydrolase [Solirubrobacterales bacterium]
MVAPIEAVTFDFWNTIARAPSGLMSEARRRAIVEACAECDVELEAELLVEALSEVTRSYESSWSVGEHFHPREGAEMLVRSLGLEGTARERTAEAFLTVARNAPVELSVDIRSSLEALRSCGIRLGIVCDVGFSGGEVLRELLDREGLLIYFSGWAFSDEVGHYKPAPQIFEAVLAALDAEPGAAMHVGDLRRTDIAGASALGMRTARYRALHDDPEVDGAIEADFVLDSHRELPPLLERLATR